MTPLFLEQAFWGFLSLTSALVIVIYTLFGRIIRKDFDLITLQIGHLSERIDSLNKRIDGMSAQENADMTLTSNLLHKLIDKDKKK